VRVLARSGELDGLEWSEARGTQRALGQDLRPQAMGAEARRGCVSLLLRCRQRGPMYRAGNEQEDDMNRTTNVRPGSFSLSPVLRGEGWGEGREASYCNLRFLQPSASNPSPPPSPRSTGERELARFVLVSCLAILMCA